MFTRSLKRKRHNAHPQSSNKNKPLEAFIPDYGDRGYHRFLDDADSSRNAINERGKDVRQNQMRQVRFIYGKKESLNSDINDTTSTTTRKEEDISQPSSPSNQTHAKSGNI